MRNDARYVRLLEQIKNKRAAIQRVKDRIILVGPMHPRLRFLQRQRRMLESQLKILEREEKRKFEEVRAFVEKAPRQAQVMMWETHDGEHFKELADAIGHWKENR